MTAVGRALAAATIAAPAAALSRSAASLAPMVLTSCIDMSIASPGVLDITVAAPVRVSIRVCFPVTGSTTTRSGCSALNAATLISAGDSAVVGMERLPLSVTVASALRNAAALSVARCFQAALRSALVSGMSFNLDYFIIIIYFVVF